MLSGSAILRISVLLVVAGCLAALVQFLLPRTASAPEPQATAAAGAAPPRRIETAQQAAPSVEAERSPKPQAVPQPVPAADAPPAQPPADQPPTLAPVAVPPPRQFPQMGEAAIDAANDAAGPRALALVDLNTGALADLNRLRGGGSIGRAIIQHRPYAAIDQLLSKRVLSRATYDKIKDQVTVR